jgi:thiamine kinase-like enzyme
MERLTAALRSLHALPIALPAFAAERIASRYLADLPADVRASRTAARWADELILFARRYDARLAPTAFCHNDLAAANILDDGLLTFVDFEYAARADPLLDLANVVVMNTLSAEEQKSLLGFYRRTVPTEEDLAELTWVARMVRLMAWFWAVLGEARAEDPSLYSPYVASLAAELKAQTGGS